MFALKSVQCFHCFSSKATRENYYCQFPIFDPRGIKIPSGGKGILAKARQWQQESKADQFKWIFFIEQANEFSAKIGTNLKL